jgi:hypothetical protein
MVKPLEIIGSSHLDRGFCFAHYLTKEYIIGEDISVVSSVRLQILNLRLRQKAALGFV